MTLQGPARAAKLTGRIVSAAEVGLCIGSCAGYGAQTWWYVELSLLACIGRLHVAGGGGVRQLCRTLYRDIK